MLNLVTQIFAEAFHILLDSAPYMLIGILMAGLLKVFLSTDFVIKHLGRGRFSSVFKAAFLGVPLPL